MFTPIFVEGGARRRGWYVRDDARTTLHATVIVGARHGTRLEAQSEARRLEVQS